MSKNVDIVVVGKDAGQKLQKAEDLGKFKKHTSSPMLTCRNDITYTPLSN